MFDDICTRIISPPKFRYSLYDLGSPITRNGKRTDFFVYNKKSIKLNCSLYEPFDVFHERVCVIYLHSMNGSRLQGQIYSEVILKEGISYCTFDFSGCGNSEGEKITFGANQKYDIQEVINKLKEKFYLNKFILWGRSMGAVSAIKYAELRYDKSKLFVSYQKDQIIGLALDSSFKSFSKLIVQIGHLQTQIPKFLIQAGYFIIKNSLERNGSFKVEQLDLISQNDEQNNLQRHPLTKLTAFQLPILFLASKQDKTVCCEHSIQMFKAYNCKYKQIKFFKGLHNGTRENDYINEVLNFLRKVLSNKQININEKSQQNLSHQESNSNIINDLSSSLNDSNSKVIEYQAEISDPVLIDGEKAEKISIIKLIQERFFNSEENQENSTYLQVQTLQPDCVCGMFDMPPSRRANNIKFMEQIDYIEKDRIGLIIEPSKRLYENKKQNINDSRFSLKNNQQYVKTKKVLSRKEKHPAISRQYRGFIKKEQNNLNRQKYSSMVAPMDKNQKIMNGSFYRQLPRQTIQSVIIRKSPQLNNESRDFDEFYKPLRMASQKYLKLPLKKPVSVKYKKQSDDFNHRPYFNHGK